MTGLPTVGTSVGEIVGVESSKTGVVPAGVIVGKLPKAKGVSVAEVRAGFCQM